MYHHSDKNFDFRAVNLYNMYVRVFTRKYDRNIMMNEADYILARKQLEYFTTIVILEKPETYQLMSAKYGIQNEYRGWLDLHDPKNKDLYYQPGDQLIMAEVQKEFEMNNKYDYMLYNDAIKLSYKMLVKYTFVTCENDSCRR